MLQYIDGFYKYIIDGRIYTYHTESTYILSHQCVSSDVLLNSAAVKNSFHTKSMNVVSPLN